MLTISLKVAIIKLKTNNKSHNANIEIPTINYFFFNLFYLDLLKDSEFMDRWAEEKFDIAIGEHFDACSFAVFHRLGIKKYIRFVFWGFSKMSLI